MATKSALVALQISIWLSAPATPSAAQEAWTPTSTAGPPSPRFQHTAVWTGSRMIVWGGDDRWTDTPPPPISRTGAFYDPATDTWTPTNTTGAPSGRTRHTAVWTGSKMIIWGGHDGANVCNTGGVYDPATNRWTPTSTVGAPSPRFQHTAVWTGSRMIVWGGNLPSGGVDFATGGVYDPAANRWTPTSTVGAVARFAHTAVWTGTKMIVWGGQLGFGPSDTGAIYDPATRTWTAISTVGAPTARHWNTGVWTGTKMVIWGGSSGGGGVGLGDGASYDPVTDTWTPMSTTGAPAGRYNHTTIWTGSKMIIWGGYSSPLVIFDSGGIYDPATDSWTATSTVEAPQYRQFHTAIWTGSRMIIWGGQASEPFPWYSAYRTDTGGVYSNPVLLPPPRPATDFYTVSPCRVIDTRTATGPTGGPALAAGASRTFPVTGVCGIPSTAVAVSVNVTVAGAATQGFLILYRSDAADPALPGTISFSAGQTLANNAIVLLASNGGTLNVQNGSAKAVHFVLDVTGYFE